MIHIQTSAVNSCLPFPDYDNLFIYFLHLQIDESTGTWRHFKFGVHEGQENIGNQP